jgi:arrestin-related trafficking adapter 3/6
MLDVKPGLSIRLTEPVVFLRTNDPSGRHAADAGDPPGLVRGLLTLNLTKPTRISSIEVELRAVAAQTWVEGESRPVVRCLYASSI